MPDVYQSIGGSNRGEPAEGSLNMQTTTRTLYLCTDVRSTTQVGGLLNLHTIEQPMIKPNSEALAAVNRQF